MSCTTMEPGWFDHTVVCSKYLCNIWRSRMCNYLSRFLDDLAFLVVAPLGLCCICISFRMWVELSSHMKYD